MKFLVAMFLLSGTILSAATKPHVSKKKTHLAAVKKPPVPVVDNPVDNPVVNPVTSVSSPHVDQCFTVHALLKTDADHYWADWTNHCPYTIDAVYVMVSFADKLQQKIGDGVWPMYFVRPGMHRVTRFSVPAEASSFESVSVRKITLDSELALR
jgi:hypothetical protein